jgi:hypothetical protein
MIPMTWLDDVQASLNAEGFTSPGLQELKAFQAFGLAKNLDSTWQIHVRGFRDAQREWIESEIEPQWIYLEHLNAEHRTSAAPFMTQILNKYRIGFIPQVDQSYKPPKVPTQLTDWRPLAGFAILLGLGFFFGSLD